MNLLVKIQNLVKRVVVDRASKTPQLRHLGDGVLPSVEHMEPQGLHFVAVSGAQGVVVCPSAQTSAAVALGLSGSVPSGDIAPGEGGLHYAATWKVFLDQDGNLHLGSKDPSDFVALASLVDARIAQLRTDITTLKTATMAVAAAIDGLIPGTSAVFSGSTTAVPAAADPVGSTTVKVE